MMDEQTEEVYAIKALPAKETINTGTVKTFENRAKKILIATGILILTGVIVYVFVAYGELNVILSALSKDHYLFYWMLLAGFLAELVAGSMGMGYGVICTTILLLLNIPLPVISASIHSAESFTTAAGSFSHYKLGNVNRKLIRALAIPALSGAVAGAILLTYLGERYAKDIKPVIAIYTMYLGIRILQNAFAGKKNLTFKKKINIPALGFAGGFIDSFGGGGWGPLVTGTFIKNGRTPRYVIGSSTVAKFILTFASAITFIFTIGIHHWNIIAGLILGGIVTAPFSAMITAKLPTRKMFVVVGVLVIVMSLITIFKTVIL